MANDLEYVVMCKYLFAFYLLLIYLLFGEVCAYVCLHFIIELLASTVAF